MTYPTSTERMKRWRSEGRQPTPERGSRSALDYLAICGRTRHLSVGECVGNGDDSRVRWAVPRNKRACCLNSDATQAGGMRGAEGASLQNHWRIRLSMDNGGRWLNERPKQDR